MDDVLVLRRGGLGDTLLMLPVLRALRRRAPGAVLHFAGVREFGDLLAGLGAADVSLSSESLALWSPSEARRRLARYRCLVTDEAAVRDAAPAGALVMPFDVRIVQPGVPFGLQLAQQLGLVSVWPDDAWLSPPQPRAGPGPRVLAPGSGGRGKCWPREHWLALAGRWAEAGVPVAVVVGPTEVERDDPRRWPWPVGTTFLVGRTPLQLAGELRVARSFVGNDSGTTHLAAMLGVPTVAVFGPTDPRVWAPVGPHVHVLGGDGRTLAEVAAEEVMAAVRAAGP